MPEASDREERSDRVTGVSDADILAEARKRFEQAQAAHSENRQRYKNAMSFVAGAQWDQKLRAFREAQMRPCLTFDRLTTHINQVVNDGRQNKPSIKAHPVAGGDVKVADVIDGLIRHVERTSDAPTAYETANFTQVAGNVGYWRILTDYVDPMSFEQDICIKRVIDPLSIWIDPAAKEQDASDMKWAFVEDRMPREDFKRDTGVSDIDWPGESDPQGWWDRDSVRVVEYMRIVKRPTTLFLLPDGQVMTQEAYNKAFPAAAAQAPQIVARRSAKLPEVQWFKLGGNSVVDSRVLPGKWIPIIRVVGNEAVIDGKIVYTGMTDRMMDAQRAYNYQASTVVEILALQKSAPYIGAKGQFKGRELQWKQANVNMPAYLEYEPVEINGNLAPPPSRQPPPQVPTGNVQAMQLAADDMRWISGQHAATFGAQSNEQSGRAILARERQGDAATYQYPDNIARSIRHTGRVLIDMFPDVYDTPRVLRIVGEDGKADYVKIDPTQPEAVREVEKPEGGVERIYNLNVGRYDVAVSVGPSFGTKRMEAVEAMTQLFQSSPQIAQAAADIYVRNQDWPGAQELADRLGKLVPPELKADEASSPEQRAEQLQQQLQQQAQIVEQLGAALEDAMNSIERAKAEAERVKAEAAASKAQSEAEKVDIEAFRAETERMKVVGAMVSPEQIQALVLQTVASLATTTDVDLGDGGLPPIIEPAIGDVDVIEDTPAPLQ
jgi:hypothetical protein